MVGGRFGQVGACEAGSRAKWRLGGATFKTASKDALTASPDLIPVEPDLWSRCWRIAWQQSLWWPRRWIWSFDGFFYNVNMNSWIVDVFSHKFIVIFGFSKVAGVQKDLVFCVLSEQERVKCEVTYNSYVHVLWDISITSNQIISQSTRY